jgi:hypothetical protein
MEANALAVKKPHPNLRWFAELQPEPGTSKPWIRILRLKAGAFEDPIHGHLKVEELDTVDPFDALSYCCGPDILSCSITINNTPEFRITENLWNALQRIRKTGGDRRLWVDAICINQEDVTEKSSQIRNMHAVYSRAKEVCIYFGECKEQPTRKSEIEHIYRHMFSVSENVCRDSPFSYEMYRVMVFNDLRIEGCTPDVYKHFAHEFVVALEKDLLGNTRYDSSFGQFWWKRLWTVQELVLAKHPVVYCGPYVMLWAVITQLWAPESGTREPPPSGAAPSVSSKMCNDIGYLESLRGQPKRSLHALLLATVDKGFTNPKDRILALLGALPQETISLDYSMVPRAIYTSTATHCIATQATFEILFSQWHRTFQLESEAERLYSCVPDFDRSHGTLTQTWQTPCLIRPEQGRWEGARVSILPDLSAFERHDSKRKESLSILTGKNIGIEVIENTASRCRVAFTGARVTTIRKLYRLGHHNLDWILADLSTSTSQYFAGSLCKGSRHWNVWAISQREQHAYDLYTMFLESCSLHLEGNIEKFMNLKSEVQRQQETTRDPRRTIYNPKECVEFLAIADKCLRCPWDESLVDPLASHTAPTHLLKPLGVVHEVLETLLSAVLQYKTWSGTFFITSDGHLGIGPELTQPGDQIVVLDGARSPFVLRALENNSDYALLGDSFVLGLMHGEVIDMDARGELHCRTFVLQ